MTDMLRDLIDKVSNAETVQAYNQAVKELADYLREAGKFDKAQQLMNVSTLRSNRFSKREEEENLILAKNAVVEYCELLQAEAEKQEPGKITRLLENFHLFC